jgi:hypothetical protein
MLDRWRDLAEILPELPLGRMIFRDGLWVGTEPGDSLLPAARVAHAKIENSEDPELYAVWPFGLFGAELPHWNRAKNAFDARLHPKPRNGWSQTAIWAARLGLGAEAADLALSHFEYNGLLPCGWMDSPSARFPGRTDVPDCPFFDALGAAATAVNEMLLQDRAGRTVAFPAWPANEHAAFRLHAADGPVEAEV